MTIKAAAIIIGISAATWAALESLRDISPAIAFGAAGAAFAAMTIVLGRKSGHNLPTK